MQQSESGAVGTPLLDVRNLWFQYGRGRSERAAVRDVSLQVEEGRTLALVGESGSGKTTVARLVAGLLASTAGEIKFGGRQVPGPVARRDPSLRRDIQYVFQNADASLNPRHRVGDIIGRPLHIFHGLRGDARRRQVQQLLNDVKLDGGYAERYPAHLSGGERQRVAIARALAAKPRLLLCDEILTALDLSVQAAILQLLGVQQRERGLAYVFISHDLGVVRSIADQVAVLYRGRVVETGSPDELFTSPRHPYSRLLIDSIPDPGQRDALSRVDHAAEETDAESDEGCPFTPRCPQRIAGVCDREQPGLYLVTATHAVRCHAAVG